jgi:hypothetical protein
VPNVPHGVGPVSPDIRRRPGPPRVGARFRASCGARKRSWTPITHSRRHRACSQRAGTLVRSKCRGGFLAQMTAWSSSRLWGSGQQASSDSMGLDTSPHLFYVQVERHCRLCMARGYHSVLHQIESVTPCPAHRCALKSICRRCGRQAPHHVCLQLLEAPYRCPYCRERFGVTCPGIFGPAET